MSPWKKEATRNQCIASSNKCPTTSNKKLLETRSFPPVSWVNLRGSGKLVEESANTNVEIPLTADPLGARLCVCMCIWCVSIYLYIYIYIVIWYPSPMVPMLWQPFRFQELAMSIQRYHQTGCHVLCWHMQHETGTHVASHLTAWITICQTKHK